MHPSTIALLRNFEFEHLPPGLREVSQHFHVCAYEVVAMTPEGPELTVALRKLVEAKDCAVRAHLPPKPELDIAIMARVDLAREARAETAAHATGPPLA